MKHDEIEIFNAHFLPHGATIGTDMETRRVASYVKDFARALPQLRHLRTSQLVTHKQHTEDGINLSIRLRDRNLRSVFDQQSAIHALNEFESEVADIRHAIEQLPTAIAYALSPAVSPERLRDTGLDTEQVRALRRIFLKRRDLNIFSGFRKLQMTATAHIFAQGTVAEIRATFETLRRGKVQLNDVSLSGYLPIDVQGLDLSGLIWMSHPGIKIDRPNVTRFFELVETGNSAVMEVLIAWDAVSGQPHHLEFRKFLTSFD